MEAFVRESHSLQCLVDLPSGTCTVASKGLVEAIGEEPLSVSA